MSRVKLTGPVVDELKEKPISDKTVINFYKGQKNTNHMQDFFEYMKDSSTIRFLIFTKTISQGPPFTLPTSRFDLAESSIGTRKRNKLLKMIRQTNGKRGSKEKSSKLTPSII